MSSKYLLFLFTLLFISCTNYTDPGVNLQITISENQQIILQKLQPSPWKVKNTISSNPYSFDITTDKVNQSEIKITLEVRKADESWGVGTVSTIPNHPASFDIINGNTQLRAELIPIKALKK